MLLDTNIVSYLFKRDSRAEAYLPHFQGQRLHLSFMTVAEIYRWPFERNWSEPRKQALELFLRSHFTVLRFDNDLAWTWAELVGQKMRGQPMSVADSWIAATALQHQMPLVTHNARHFFGVPGLTVITEA
ncbi:tRNA(fMet)-specific endonuclease VapC [Prosthecobacter fusiformis]|uniref:Ribonuclease VapC n=1 Tax=Prosthecobacter fusiformis TaxID=48464 RepID=A0A4R7RP52_9BACT|nr:type II toxin-antitoxin system VapC family toxin [Prosthecobacter fusiformis]TDU67260.1 tRNA(fMet)-specific endonuclease VapC [Prosthecobacter fusiformis]